MNIRAETLFAFSALSFLCGGIVTTSFFEGEVNGLDKKVHTLELRVEDCYPVGQLPITESPGE